MKKYILDYFILLGVKFSEQRKNMLRLLLRNLFLNKQVNITRYICAEWLFNFVIFLNKWVMPGGGSEDPILAGYKSLSGFSLTMILN